MPATAPRRARGFTLLEMLVVLVIIGLIASLVGPKLFNRVDTSKVQVADTQARMLRGAVETFHLEVGRLPTVQEGLAVLTAPPADERAKARWRGPYLDEAVPMDPWGNAYAYRSPGERSAYEIRSFGSDGQEGGSGAAADIDSDQN